MILYFFSIDGDKRIWSFDLSSYDEVQKKVGALSPHVVIGQLPSFVLKLLKQGNVGFFELILICQLMFNQYCLLIILNILHSSRSVHTQ